MHRNMLHISVCNF